MSFPYPSYTLQLTPIPFLDVGGGWVSYSERAALSRIALRWVVREATEVSSILWDEDVLKRFRVRRPTSPKEIKEYIEKENADALSKFHDAFQWNFFWILMEFIPLLFYIKVFGRWLAVMT